MPQSSTGPATFICVMCEQYITREDILWSHKAEQLDETRCICNDCFPKWQEKINPPDLEHIEDTKKKESFISHYLKHAHENKLQRLKEKEEAKKESIFNAFIHTSLDDPSLRAILIAIASIPTSERESLLNTLITQLETHETQDELLAVLRDLKNDDEASKAIELLEGKEK